MSSDFDFVLAVDPGGTTGVAWHIAEVPLVDADQVPGGEEGFYAWWNDLFQNINNTYRRPTMIIVEDFKITPTTHKKTPQPDAMRIIGALRYWGYSYDVPVLTPSPADKAFGTDDKLKALGWWQPGKGHANDALRHLLNQLVELRYPPMLRRMVEIAEDL